MPQAALLVSLPSRLVEKADGIANVRSDVGTRLDVSSCQYVTAGIGFWTAHKLLQHGAHVIITGRNPDKAKKCAGVL